MDEQTQENDTYTPSTLKSYVAPAALAAISLASMAAILHSGAPEDMLAAGMRPAALGVCAAILPAYIAHRWIGHAISAIPRTQGVLGNLRHVAIIGTWTLFMVDHVDIIASLASKPIARAGPDPDAHEPLNMAVGLLVLIVLADMLLFMACEARAGTARKRLRTLLSVLSVLLAVVCCALYGFAMETLVRR